MSPPSSGSRGNPSKKLACYLLQAGFLLGLFFDSEYVPSKRRFCFQWTTLRYIPECININNFCFDFICNIYFLLN
jgi:hypothetical protein